MTEPGRVVPTDDATAADTVRDAELSRLEGLLGQARDHIVQLDWSSATQVLDDVATSLADRPRDAIEAAVHVEWLVASAGVAAETRGDARDPWDLLDRAVVLQERFGLEMASVRLTAQRAFLHQRAGNLEAALAELAKVGDSLDGCPPAVAVKVLLNRGTLHMEVGSVDAAVVDLATARQRALTAGLELQAFTARHNLGWAEYLRGDLPRALSLVGGLDVHAPDAVTTHPVALMDRAQIMAEAGLVDEADELLDRAITGLADAGSVRDEGEARLARARVALVAGDLPMALDESLAAGVSLARHGNRRWQRRAEMARLATLVELAQADHRRGSVDGASIRNLRHEINDFVAMVADTDDRMLAMPAQLMAAEVALVDDDLAEATQILAEVDVREAANVSVRMRWHRVRAELALRRDGDVAATVSVGLAELARAQAQLGSMDLRTAIAIHGKEVAQIGVDWALRHGDSAAVHDAVERARASSTRLPVVRADLDPIDRDLLARLRRATGALERIDSGNQPDTFERLRQEVSDVRARLRSRSWRHAGAGEATGEVVALEVAAAALRRRNATAVTWTATGDDELRAVVVAGSDLRVVDLGSAARRMADSVARLRSDMTALLLAGVPEAVRGTMRASMQRALAELDDTLLHPLGLAGDAAVVLVPTGPLALVPWGLVPSRRRRSTTIAPCLTDWCRSQADRHEPSDGVTVIAGPRLDRAFAEARAVGTHWDEATVLVGKSATTSAARLALRTSSVVHLALHGRHRERSPLFSSIELVDGELFAHELTNDVGCDLVVLSACEVGAAQMREGDEPLGLTAALHQAGARTVVAGLAPVRDDVAHDVMVDFHALVAAGASPSLALGEAVATAWDSGSVAPFASVGAGVVPVESSS